MIVLMIRVFRNFSENYVAIKAMISFYVFMFHCEKCLENHNRSQQQLRVVQSCEKEMGHKKYYVKPKTLKTQ